MKPKCTEIFADVFFISSRGLKFENIAVHFAILLYHSFVFNLALDKV